jgi:hypothetical protein
MGCRKISAFLIRAILGISTRLNSTNVLKTWRDVSPTFAVGKDLIQDSTSFGLAKKEVEDDEVLSGVLSPSVFCVSMDIYSCT